MRRSDLLRVLARVPTPERPRAELEQVVTPPDAAAKLLLTALARDDLAGRSVVDLGAGTGRLAIGAATLGARTVRGVEEDAALVAVARAAAAEAGVAVSIDRGDVRSWTTRADTVVMNPPFGAQRRHADRPFWGTALSIADRAVYAFALRDARPYVLARAAEHGAIIESLEPVGWSLPRTFPHHTHDRRSLDVDLWVLRIRPRATRLRGAASRS